MSLKSLIESEISLLERMADERNTTQGKFALEKAQEQLGLAKSNAEELEVLNKLNRAFLGIEAHGSLSSEEYAAVCRLRELAANNALN